MLIQAEKLTPKLNHLLTDVKAGPVFVSKSGKIVSVVMSFTDYQHYQQAVLPVQTNPEPSERSFEDIFAGFKTDVDIDIEFERDQSLPQDSLFFDEANF